MHVCAWVCACMHVCVYVLVHMQMRARACMGMCVRGHVWGVDMCELNFMHMLLYVCARHVRLRMFEHIHVWVCVCACVCMHVCVWDFKYNLHQ